MNRDPRPRTTEACGQPSPLRHGVTQMRPPLTSAVSSARAAPSSGPCLPHPAP